jgi:hypothetical protein
MATHSNSPSREDFAGATKSVRSSENGAIDSAVHLAERTPPQSQTRLALPASRL